MDSFYGHSVYNNFITVERYMCSYDKLRNLSQSSLNSNVLSCFFLCERGCVCVDVLGCVIVPVRNFKTSHYPHYPLPCEFRNDVLSDISHFDSWADSSKRAHTVSQCSLVHEIIQHVEYSELMARVTKIAEHDTAHLRKQLTPTATSDAQLSW